MKNEQKKYLFQRLASIIPFFSTFVIVFITMFDLKRKKAAFKYWFLFYAGTVASFLLYAAISSIPFIRQEPVARYVIAAVIMTALNFLYVELQICAAANASIPSFNFKGFLNTLRSL